MKGSVRRVIGIWLVGVLALYGASVCIGIGWGLPSARHDLFLFGEERVWTGEAIANLAGGGVRTDPRRGADVDANPLSPATGAVVLNNSTRAQAEIYRRFCLFTRQPDEMITMMALSGMDPGKGRFDPKLYQYGGLFIYPVGAAIWLGGATGLLPVRAEAAYYLDYPDDFGKFYIVARLYSSAWGALGVLLVYAIGRRLAGAPAGIISALLFVMLPVVVCMSHEAKPHLAGAVLMLAAGWFGMRALDVQTRRAWAYLFVCCGAAVGMVLSSWPVLVLIPLVVGLHCRSQLRRQRHEFPACSAPRGKYLPVFLRATAGGAIVATGVYFVTNPYVLINLFINRDVLASNFSNSLAMYEIAHLAEGCRRVLQLTAEGATWPVIVGGAAALVAALTRRDARVLPLTVPAVLFALQFVLIGAAKPDEYGRFGVFYECALAIGCGCALAVVGRKSRLAAVVATVVVVGWCAVCSGGYLWSFHVDARGAGSRDLAAAYLHEAASTGSVALVAEPAPYSCPPIDFGRRPVVLYRKSPAEKGADGIRSWSAAPSSEPGGGGVPPPPVLVAALDDPAAELARVPFPAWDECSVFEARLGFLPRARISWANKPIVVLSRTRD